MPGKSENGSKRTPASVVFIAGGGAGAMEALICHPLDTIKVRMQLSRRGREPGMPRRGFIRTGLEIRRREGFLALYKGLGPVLTGIIPKMAIRFLSNEEYKRMLADPDTGELTTGKHMLAGLAAGVTEAVAVVTPMEVVKIRLQAQYHSMSDPLDIPKYRNAAHAALLVCREEGFRALYRGVSLTALRQGTNQMANFTVYNLLTDYLKKRQPEYELSKLPVWQTGLVGLISGACGPFCNAPIDTIKTRLQKTQAEPGVSAIKRITVIASEMFKKEGARAFYKGITPRVARVAPGQAVTFAVYEQISARLQRMSAFTDDYKFEE